MKSYLAKLLVLIKGWDGSAFGAKGRVAMASEVSGAEVSFVTEGASSRKQRSVVLGATIGNFIEWYDWTIYGLFSGVFASQIFPSNDKTVSLLVVLSTFALGFLMRPVGAIVLSPIADRIGRRQMLSLTLLLMGAGSLAIALTPSFETIGFGAPVIVLLARLLQGFSAGGEYQGASVFLVEHAPATRRGFIGSMQNLSIGLAVLAANGVATLTTANLPNAELHDWGWRVPFFVGALMSLYGFYIRRSLPETPLFLETASHAGVEKRPLLRVIREFPREALYVFSVQITTVFFYLWTIYLPTYAKSCKQPSAEAGIYRRYGRAGGILHSPADRRVCFRQNRPQAAAARNVNWIFATCLPDACGRSQRRFRKLYYRCLYWLRANCATGFGHARGSLRALSHARACHRRWTALRDIIRRIRRHCPSDRHKPDFIGFRHGASDLRDGARGDVHCRLCLHAGNRRQAAQIKFNEPKEKANAHHFRERECSGCRRRHRAPGPSRRRRGNEDKGHRCRHSLGWRD